MGTGTLDLPVKSETAHARMRRWYSWENVAPYVFISPFFILFGIFGVFPILFALWISFRNWKGIRGGEFIGFENFTRLLTDSFFHTALKNTMILGLLYTTLMILLSLGFAALLNRPMRGRALYRTAYFLPVVTSMVVVAILFKFFMGSTYSPLTPVLAMFGIEFRGLLGMAWAIKPILLVMMLWRWVEFNMMIMLAGLQSIPAELYDAARIDGAGDVQAFRYITVPLMRRVIAFVAIVSTIGMFEMFEMPYLLLRSGGGVDRAGLLTAPFIFQQAFELFKFGYASAIAYVIALIIIGLSLLQMFASERTASE